MEVQSMGRNLETARSGAVASRGTTSSGPGNWRRAETFAGSRRRSQTDQWPGATRGPAQLRFHRAQQNKVIESIPPNESLFAFTLVAGIKSLKKIVPPPPCCVRR